MSYSFPDYSSSPAPSTPDKKTNKSFSFGANNPSTTPAGPPPSSAGSFTPAGAPPTNYGSSVFGNTSMKPLSFDQSRLSQGSPLRFGESVISEEYTPQRSAFQDSNYDDRHKPSPKRGYSMPEYSDDEQDEDAEGDEEDMEDVDQEIGQEYEQEDRRPGSRDNYSDEADMEEQEEPGRHSFFSATQRSDLGRSIQDHTHSLRRSRTMHTPQELMYGTIAKDLISQLGSSGLSEPDGLILNTDALVSHLYGIENDHRLTEALSTTPAHLSKLWSSHQKQTRSQDFNDYAVRIGPGPQESAFSKANFIANLVLRVQHPQFDERQNRMKPLPQALLEWLNEYHDPYPTQIEDLYSHKPSPSNSDNFWHAIFNSLLRGRIAPVIQILRNAGWRHANTTGDEDSRHGGHGYAGSALAAVERVVAAAVDVLAQCPGNRNDWDVRGENWTFFRLRAAQALTDLRKFAEGPDYQKGKGHSAGTYSQTAQMAQSAVPWTVYQYLSEIYGVLSGESKSICDLSQDWVEATIGLAVWWDASKSEKKSDRPWTAQSLINGRDSSEAYVLKLRKSFSTATFQDKDLQVNTSDAVEVALASAFEGDHESVVAFLRTWSAPIASAVAELGAIAGWLPQSEPQSLISMDELDEEDLIALGHSPSPSKSDGIKDKTLIAYATHLGDRGTLEAEVGDHIVVKQGWELALSTLGRLESVSRSEQIIGDVLKHLPLDSSDTVDRLWKLLMEIEMKGHAEKTAEAYASSLADSSHNYGEALWYYALAHQKTKVKDVLDLLISHSLLQSVAYPPEAEMDEHLTRLMSSPKDTIMSLSRLDKHAADLLYHSFTGYATLRQFYNIRDQPGGTRVPGKVSSLSQGRQSEAISALLAVLKSSAESINGGLYDDEAEAVVNLDFLLALLGEALVFVSSPNVRLAVSDIDILLKAVEDLQTVGSRVYANCSEFLQTVLASAHGLKGSTPADLLKKSTSNLSGSSSFSMVGSSMLASQLKQSMGGSGVLVKGNVKRGWDWRNGLSVGVTPEDILRLLRLGLAKKLASAWLAEADDLM